MAHADRAGHPHPGRDQEYGQYPDDMARLKDLESWQLAGEEPDPRGFELIGRDGEKIGTIEDFLASPSTRTAYFVIVNTGGWFDDRRFAVPLAEMRFHPKEMRAYGPFTQEQFRSAPEYREGHADWGQYYTYWHGRRSGEWREGKPTEVRIPEVEETAEVHKERREAGYVTLSKRVETETQHISEPVMHTRVVAETREVPAGEAYTPDPNVRTLREGETLRVPIVEEELKVEKQPRVRREVVLRTEAETHQEERDVELRRERVEVEEEGDVEVEHTTTRRRP